MTSIDFAVLGELRARRGGDELFLGSPQQQGVLVLLLLGAGRVVSHEEIIDRVWGANPPMSARVTVRTYISRLRRSLDDPAQDETLIKSSAGGYRLLVTPDSLDLALFESRIEQAGVARSSGDTARASALLHAALSLWRGVPLGGVHGEFVGQERVRLHQLRLTAFEERLTCDLELGRSREVITELDSLIEAYPYRERLHELLMLALYRASRQADALCVYQQIGALLRNELGIEPGPRLRALHQKILHSAPDLSSPELQTSSANLRPRFAQPRLHTDLRGGRVRYARNGGSRLAYRAWGDAEQVLVLVPGWVSNVDSYDDPASVYPDLIGRLTKHTRVVAWDKRGTGLSDPATGVPSLAEGMSDLCAVIDDLGADCPVLFGVSDGGPLSLLFAATYPHRVQSLILQGTAARFTQDPPDFPWGFTPAQIDEHLEEIDTHWGQGALTELIFGVAANIPFVRERVGREQRLAASPTMARLMWQAFAEIDARNVLGKIHTRTLVLARPGDRVAPFEAAAALAGRMPNAQLCALPPGEHYMGDIEEMVVSEILQFLHTQPRSAARTAAS